MGKILKGAAALALALSAFVAPAFVTALAPAFADSGNETYVTGVKEELAIVDEWVAPHAKGNPSFSFYENRSGFVKLGADDDAWVHISFIYDPKKSEYALSTPDDSAQTATARLVRAKGEPDRLLVSGEFLDYTDRKISFKYELVRAADAKKAGASLPAGEYSIRKSATHWMTGDWVTSSGAPMTLNISGKGGVVSFLILTIFGGWDSGNDLQLPANLRWDAGEKAFEIWTGSLSSHEGRTVVSDRQEWGYIRPSSGKDAPSETLRIEFNSHGRTFEAVLARKGAAPVGTARPKAEAPVFEEGFYLIQSKLSGLYLDISDAGTTEGTPLIAWEKNGKENQVFNVLSSPATDRFTIVPRHAGEMRVGYGESRKGNGIGLTPEEAVSWTLELQEDGWYKIGTGGLYWDVEGNSKQRGARIILWDRKSSKDDNQKFKFIRVE